MQQIIMGIESSCDETAVGIVRARWQPGDPAGVQIEVVANQVASSMQQHARFGGVVPEVASRAHLEAMTPTMAAALEQLQETCGVDRPDVVSATVGPGLAGALLVGASAAKAYAAGWQVPFIGMNHLAGHVGVGMLADPEADFSSAVALLVSGGHTQLLQVNGLGNPLKELGSTLDDAAGEAYDKVSRLLGLGYPGGPIIDRLARQGNPKAIRFPRGVFRAQDMRGPHRYDFSFSGLKTAVARYVEKAEREAAVGTGAPNPIPIEDICASFQEAVCDVLTAKTVLAARDLGADTVLIGGGVAANSRLRELATARCASAGVKVVVPELALCTDNGVMIATAAAQALATGAQYSTLEVGVNPSLSVAQNVVA